ncbi:MAG: recombinase family protein, partial [Clostridiaceae bacterium]|nr:recombinase family protein [Clostridiaceae bacterium]
VFYKSMLRRQGVEVVSISEPIIDGPFGQLIERIIEWMDEYYSIRLGEEVKRSMTVLAREGRPLTTAPMGYRMENGQLVPDPREALIINEIFSRFTNGESLLAISREFNSRGIRTHHGGLIESRSLSYILQNPVYIGKTRWTPTGRTRRNFANPDTIIASGLHEAIISLQMWEKAQSIISSEKKSRTPPHSLESHKSWLSGLIRCSECGNWLVASGKSSMQCGAYAKGKCKVSHSVTKSALESSIILQLRSDAEKSVSTCLCQKKSSAASCADVYQKRALDEITRRLERLREAYLSGAEELDDYQKAKQELELQALAIRKTPAPADTPKNAVDARPWLDDPVFILEDSNASEKEKYKAAHDTISYCIYDKHERTLSVIYKADQGSAF